MISEATGEVLREIVKILEDNNLIDNETFWELTNMIYTKEEN